MHYQHRHLSTTKRNRESNYPFPEKAADHVEKAPDGQSEAGKLWDLWLWYLFPVAFVCFWNTSKMVADDCIRLQNMVGLFAALIRQSLWWLKGHPWKHPKSVRRPTVERVCVLDDIQVRRLDSFRCFLSLRFCQAKQDSSGSWFFVAEKLKQMC